MVCNWCQGEGHTHRPSCPINLEDANECTCDAPKCRNCKGEGVVKNHEKKKSGLIKAIDKARGF